MIFIVMGAVFGALAIMLGATGAHLLASSMTEQGHHLFSLANQFHFYHVLALMAIGSLCLKYSHNLLHWAGWLMTAGMVCFSGSLYLLAVIPLAILNSVAPIGGMLLIAGWITLATATVILLARR